MWISPSFHLKVIRTFDMVTSAPEKLSGQAADKMQAGVILLDFMRRELNLSNSSVLGACQKLQEAVGLPNLAPRYAIDAPADAHDGSSRPTLSLSALLKQYGNDDVVKPDKEQAENKIDGAVALIMAVGRAMLYEKEDTLSDHIESYGIRSL